MKYCGDCKYRKSIDTGWKDDRYYVCSRSKTKKQVGYKDGCKKHKNI